MQFAVQILSNADTTSEHWVMDDDFDLTEDVELAAQYREEITTGDFSYSPGHVRVVKIEPINL